MNPFSSSPRQRAGTAITLKTAMPTRDCRLILRRIYVTNMSIYIPAMEMNFFSSSRKISAPL
jgi:hypothetical protein